jgi:hypothetical protein
VSGVVSGVVRGIEGGGSGLFLVCVWYGAARPVLTVFTEELPNPRVGVGEM